MTRQQAFARTDLGGWLQKDTAAAAESAENTEVGDRQPDRLAAALTVGARPYSKEPEEHSLRYLA